MSNTRSFGPNSRGVSAGVARNPKPLGEDTPAQPISSFPQAEPASWPVDFGYPVWARQASLAATASNPSTSARARGHQLPDYGC